MNITIDTSIVIAVISEEGSKNSIVEATKGKLLIAPQSLHWEIGDAFSAMYKKHKITYKQSLMALEIYKTIPIRFINIELESALELSHTLGIYAYDSYILATALKLRTPIISLDNSLVQAARQLKIETVEV